MTTNQNGKHFLLILILGFLTAMGPLATDIYLPAFADIAQKLNTHISNVSLSLSSFFIGLSIGQLIYGPLLERFGRKKPIYVGLTIYILSSLGCTVATSVNELIIYRFFQAIGACGGLVSARAVVKDLFKNEEVARIFSLLLVVVAVSPIIAPTVGGFITAYFSWRYVFAILVILAFLVFVASFFLLPESKLPDPNYSLNIITVFKNYIGLINNSQFAIYAVAGSVSYSGVYSYLSGSPHLYFEIFEVSQNQYSLIFAIIAAGLIGASQVNRLVLKRQSVENIVFKALIVQCFFAITLIIFYFIDITGLYITTFLIFGYMTCLGFIFPNASALSLTNLGHTAGNASALLGSIQMVLGAIASAIVSLLQDKSAFSMLIVMTFCAFSGWIILRFNRKKVLVS